MPLTTPRYKLRFPEDTDSPDIPRDFENLALDVEKNLLKEGLPRFANAAERDAAYAAAGGAPAWAVCWMIDTKALMQYVSGTWALLLSYTVGAIQIHNPALASTAINVTEATWAADIKLVNVTRSGNKLTAPVTGTYKVNYWANFQSHTGGTHRAVGLQIGTANTDYMSAEYIGIPTAVYAGLGQGASGSAFYKMTAGETLRMVLRQDSGVSLNVTGGFGMELV